MEKIRQQEALALISSVQEGILSKKDIAEIYIRKEAINLDIQYELDEKVEMLLS